MGRGDVVERAPQTDGETREVSGAEGGGFGGLWTDDREAEDVGLHLHECVVGGRASVDFQIFDFDSKQVSTISGSENMFAPRWSPDGQRLASGSWDRTVKVWEAASWRLLHDLPYPSSSPGPMCRRDRSRSLRQLRVVECTATLRTQPVASGERSAFHISV